jgi:hypothetical protein
MVGRIAPQQSSVDSQVAIQEFESTFGIKTGNGHEIGGHEYGGRRSVAIYWRNS